jgi:Uma2 family endonuclease
MTTAEYLQTAETVLPRELAYGELRVADAPSISHQRVVRELVLALTPLTHARRLGEVLFAPMDVLLDFDAALVVQPDLLFVSRDRAHIITNRIDGAPDLVAEVLSPHPRIGRLDERVGWFARYGVRECWLADLTRKQVAVLSLSDRGIDSRAVFSGNETIESKVLGATDITPLRIFGW